MEWNNGTIFRVYVNIGDKAPASTDAAVGVGSDVDIKVDLAQQELTGNCFIGIENFVLKPRVSNANETTQDELQDYWAKTTYLQMESYQLAPYIDFSSQTNTAAGSEQDNQNLSRSTQMFARVPLIAAPTLGNSQLTTEATFALDRVLNKDSILYEMRNNPFALSNGRLKFRLLDQDGIPIPGSDLNYILKLSFTLVIYKPDENYN